ncbi:unnamed protein product [Brassica oleracea var. botrytis]|uniref:(rape) hypothetical protein n=1 Tax=Brassica napus TaxID=3708 RepID=A0A816LAS9_BRANA|nr:unnamed protein product [Brassica napus]
MRNTTCILILWGTHLLSSSCCTCSQPVSEDSITPNLTLRVAVQAFCREEKSHSNHSSKRKREGFDQERHTFGDTTYTNRSRNRTNHFPFVVADRVIIKVNPVFLLPALFYSKCIFLTVRVKHGAGNERTPPRFY